MKNYLLLDSSFDLLSVGLTRDNKLVDQISYVCYKQQSKYMILEIQNILKHNKLIPTDINGIVVTNGPGSYVGIHIALTIAKTMALALQIPIYVLSSLEVNKKCGDNSIVLFNAKNNRSYIAAFDKKRCLLKEQIMDNKNVKKYICSHADFHLMGDLSYLNLKGEKINILMNMNYLFKKAKLFQYPYLIEQR